MSIYKKVLKDDKLIWMQKGNHICYYHNAPVNWIRSHTFVPYFCSERDGEGITTQLKKHEFNNEKTMRIASSILNSSLFFLWWLSRSDCYHLNAPEISLFPFSIRKDNIENEIVSLSNALQEDMIKKSKRRVYNYKTSGRVEYDEFYMKKSKIIIDKIDIALAKHYGFTQEELDFIINYDIKYRLGGLSNDNDRE